MNNSSNPNPSPLDNLTPAQRDQLFAWLEDQSVSEVIKLVAQPEPEGFGIATYDMTLRRWHRREKLARRSADLEHARDVASASGDGPVLHLATTTALRQAAFDLINAPKVTAREFEATARWILRLRDQEHQAEALAVEKQRLALEREKSEFNAARQALVYHIDLGQISTNTQLDDERKILAARDRIFGKPQPPN